jgi:hypothetical protein
LNLPSVGILGLTAFSELTARSHCETDVRTSQIAKETYRPQRG